MSGRLIIDGNAVYEIDEDCMQYRMGGKLSGQNLCGKKSVYSQCSERSQASGMKPKKRRKADAGGR